MTHDDIMILTMFDDPYEERDVTLCIPPSGWGRFLWLGYIETKRPREQELMRPKEKACILVT